MKKQMRRMLSLLLAGALGAACLTGCGADQKKTEAAGPYANLIGAFTEAIDTDYAYRITEKLATDEAMGGACGFRTAGSDYEHACADYLVSEMEALGLEDIEKIPVTVDKWQFNAASLTIGGTDIAYEPASYAQSGTDADGITAEIVNVGTGTAGEYEGLDVNGKIVLAGIDQRNEAWIDGYLQEADLHGAAALVTYDVGGYAQASPDIRNIQDVCTDDIMPCVSLSYNEGQAVIQAIEAGNSTCTLKVDNIMEPEAGVSYTVAGKIRGKSSDQQMIFSGHYDKYFYGFQDDCSAIGCIFSIAKAMKDSGYTPENDLLFVCHGAEEWGATATQFDWATGSWETINHAKPEWAGKTFAMFNFELCALKEETDAAGFVQSVPEMSTFVGNYVENYGALIHDDAFEDGITGETAAVQTMEDGIGYRFAGVPYMVNGIDFSEEESFSGQKYHTEADDATTWNEDVMRMNIGWFGGMGILTDQQPALELDFTVMTDWLQDTVDEKAAAEAEADLAAFETALADFQKAGEAVKAEATRINEEYAKALADNNAETAADLRAQGAALNKKTLEAFRILQNSCLGIVSSSAVVTFHEGYNESLALLSGAAEACRAEKDWTEEEDGALDYLWQLNGAIAYGALLFSPENQDKTVDYYEDDAEKFWGTDRIIEFAEVEDALTAIDSNGDFAAALRVIQDAREDMLEELKESYAKETAGLKQVCSLLAA